MDIPQMTDDHRKRAKRMWGCLFDVGDLAQMLANHEAKVGRLQTEIEALRDNTPWKSPPLDQWLIVGMNHYHFHGERCLYVAMTNNGRCIQAEGPIERHVWLSLVKQATPPAPPEPRKE